MPQHTCCQFQIHQLVLVAQVFIFSIVGSGVVGLETNGQCLSDVVAEASRQTIGVTMLAPAVGQRVLHDIKGQTLLHEDGTCHIAARLVVVADSTIEHCARVDAIVRLDAGMKVVE